MRRIRAVIIGCLLLGLAFAAPALASGVTNAGDDLRTGWYPDQPTLTPQLVSGGTFGQLWSTSVNGQVYAQPLLSNGTLFIATETNHIYGMDPATGAVQWTKALPTPWNPADLGCGDLTPSIGITSTPVIDTTTNTAYLTYKTYVSGTSGPAAWFMDAYDVTTGAQRAGFPVALTGAAQNAPGRTFNATNQLQRPGLLLLGGAVYAAFGSHCDFSPWQGWVFGVSTAGHVTARWVSNATANGGGIWQSGVGLTSDGPGRILLTTGNGGAPTVPSPGNTPPANLGESVVRLQVMPDGTLQAADFFAPFDAASLDSFDADFASGGLTGLPDAYFGTATLPHLGVVVGKSGYVYLLNRDSLGGFNQGPGGTEAVVQRLGPRGGVWSRPGIWPGDGGWVYIPTASGSSGGGLLDVYKYGLSGTGQPSLSLQASSSDVFGWGSGAPVITSNGTASGSALVWIIWSTNRTGAGGQLRAYDPVPVNGHPVLRWSAPIGTASNYSTPGVGAGRLYVGTRGSKVLGFGSPITPSLSGAGVAFPTTIIGNTSSGTLTLTANQTITISALAATSTQFTLGTPSPALPATLLAGQTISVPVTFAPTQTGIVGGQVNVTAGGSTAASFALSGTGQSAQPLLSVSPPVVSMGGTAVGGHLSGTATFSNLGSVPLTINSVTLPAAPFSATGVPAVGSTIAPGGSVTVNLSFDPTSLGTFVDSIGVTTTGGNGTVGLSAIAGSAGALKITSESNDYGAVAVGTTATQSFTLTNTGGTNITITKSKPPSGGAFAATTSLQEGTTIAPGATLTETVSFTPTGPGYAAGTWQINGDDSTGLHQVQFTGTGTVPAPTTSSWTKNGSATLSGSTLSLTGTGTFLAGSSFLNTPLDSHHIVVTFDSTISGGSGADGSALVFADPTRGAIPTSVGAYGGGLGFSGVPGIAVALDTFKNSVNPSANFIGITDGPTSPGGGLLHWLSTNSTIASLRTLHHMKVELLNGTITVSMDGAVVLTQAVTVPSSVLLGFSGGTGGATDNHQVANVVVTGDVAPPPQPATLTVSNTVIAPVGAPQLGAQMTFSGSCPSAFTTAALGNAGSASPTLTGPVAGSSCSVSEPAPPAGGGTWVTTVSVNGGAPVTLTAVAGQLTVPSFALTAGSNTVAFTNTWLAPTVPATLMVSNSVVAPAGTSQLGATMVFSGTCPSAFTTAALGDGGTASPTLSGAGAGASCSVGEPAPPAGGGTWVTTASVNGGAPVTLTSVGGQLTVPSFVLVAGSNTVAFTNTWVAPSPATLALSNTVIAPAGSSELTATMVFSGTCPSGFTTAALGDAGTASPTLTGAVAGVSCTVGEPAPAPGGGTWVTTASVNGGAPVTLTAVAGQLTVPSFAMLAGSNTVSVTNTWVAPPPLIPDPTAGGWQLNGTSAISGTQLVLTPATSQIAGTAFWPQAVDPRNITVSFDASLTGGTGADGMTLIFADVSKGAKPTSLGVKGGGLGFSGIPGLAVALDTYKNAVNPSANFAGITDGPISGATDQMHWLATANLSATLRGAAHHITVNTSNGTLTVSVDGTQVLSQAVALPASAYLGFGAGTGGLTDVHAVANVVIGASGPPPPAALTVSETVAAPSGSSQLGATFAVSGSCPSSFTTVALGTGSSASPPLSGAVAGSPCTLSEPVPAAPAGASWTVTAAVNGAAAQTLAISGGLATLSAFALHAGTNTVALTSTYVPPPPPPTLTVSEAVSAPSGSPQLSTTFAVSGSCPSSFTTAALGNGAGASPTLAGATAGSPCVVSEPVPAAPAGASWTVTASVNGGAAQTLAITGGIASVASFALLTGVNTVAFNNTYTPAPAPASLTVSEAVSAPSGSPQLGATFVVSGTCPSSFTTAALGNAASTSPTLTGAVTGSACAVSESVPAAPVGASWAVTASVNGGAAQTLTLSSGSAGVPSFALRAGTNTVAFTNTFTPPAASLVPDPTAGGWRLNGKATLNGGALQLTDTATTFEAGSAFWPTPINPQSLRIDFDATIGGGTGADGLAFVFQNAVTGPGPTALGRYGGGLGFSGVQGLAVALDTYQNSVNPSSNFVGISDGPTASSNELLHWLATFKLAASLRTGTHHVRITTTPTTVTVAIDGTQVLSQAVTLPVSAYLGFSGGTGGLTDRHAVANLTVVAGP